MLKARVARESTRVKRLSSVDSSCIDDKLGQLALRFREALQSSMADGVLRHAAAAAAPKEILAVTAVEEASLSLGFSSPDDGLAALLGNAIALS